MTHYQAIRVSRRLFSTNVYRAETVLRRELTYFRIWRILRRIISIICCRYSLEEVDEEHVVELQALRLRHGEDIAVRELLRQVLAALHARDLVDRNAGASLDWIR